ncbi:MAG: exostosin family protein [Cyanobacteria bacterium]|nr:exostosin family protein [Cyanobacteriota bacterium]
MNETEALPWQQPNATEATAAERLAAADLSSGNFYLAYPWATFVDRIRRGSPVDVESQLCMSTNAPGNGITASVCQHIWAFDHLDLFQKAGITDLFWSHATKGLQQVDGIRIHPFPLYPVRCATHPPQPTLLALWQRPLLYSFQGAYAPGLYLTPVRDWLLDLPLRSDALLERRSEWHYEQAVYREQVLRQAADEARRSQLVAEASAYADTLQKSCFALCPSGSGPNSIRLWEALGYGAIPVILSDQLQLPGPAPLWQSAALFVPETQEAVAALPSQLEALATDPQRLEAMQQAGQQLWHRYGLNGLATDVVEFLRDPLPVLRSRALQQLPGEALELTAASPAALPLELRRCLRTAPQDRSLMIQITDQEAPELLQVRWGAALQICAELLGSRPWGVASLSPALERFGSKQCSRLS